MERSIWRSEILHLIWAAIAAHTPPDERGQDLAEYALLIGFIAVVVIAVVVLLGDGLSLLLGEIAGEVGP